MRRGENDLARAARVQVNLGSLYRDMQEPRQALDQFHQAVPLLRASADRSALAAALNNLATAYGALGLYQWASPYLEEALQLNRELGNRRTEGRTLSNLGWSLHYAGEPAAALGYFEMALELRRTPSDEKAEASISDRKAEASILHNAAQSYRAIGETEKALGYYERSLELKRTLGDRRGEAVTLTEIASIHVEREQPSKAAKLLEHALELSRSVNDQRNEAAALLGWAQAEKARGNSAAALEYVEGAVRIIESRRGRVGSGRQRAAFLATKHRFYEFWIDALMELHFQQPSSGFATRALEASEQTRARSLVDMIEGAQVTVDRRASSALQKRTRQLLRQVHRLELERARAAASEADGTAASEAEQQLISALAELELVQSQIRDSNPAYAALTEPQVLRIPELREQILDPETVLLEFALGAERSFLWVVSNAGIDTFLLPGKETVDTAVRQVVELLIAREQTPEGESLEQRAQRIQQADEAYPMAALELSQMLLGSATAASRARRWLVVAEGALSYLPLAALADPWRDPAPEAAWRPILLEHEIVRLPSASALAALRQQPPRAPAAKPLLVLADPVFDREDPRVADLLKGDLAATSEPAKRRAPGLPSGECAAPVELIEPRGGGGRRSRLPDRSGSPARARGDQECRHIGSPGGLPDRPFRDPWDPP